MAITNNKVSRVLHETTGVTSGNEIIWELDRGSEVIVEAIPTAAGTAQTYCTVSNIPPTDFTTMIPVGEASTTAFQDATLASGQGHVGVKVDSGTWTVRISQIKQYNKRN